MIKIVHLARGGEEPITTVIRKYVVDRVLAFNFVFPIYVPYNRGCAGSLLFSLFMANQ